jgi:2-methylisocitrate lyase-like PEP mutase family enzyme
LRNIIATGQIVVAPGVIDGISANLVRRMGFSAAFMSGAGVAASGFGVPDFGLVTASEMAERAAMMTDVLGDVPLIADADAGFGGPLNVARTVQSYERAGVAALQLEDQAFPKRAAHLPNREVVSQDVYLARLGAALDARIDALIVARTDARSELGLNAAIDRANTYAEAGADIVVVESLVSTDDVERVATEVAAPLLINLVQIGQSPGNGLDRLQELGYAVAIHPGAPAFAVTEAMMDQYERLGGIRPTVTSTGSAYFFDLVGSARWSAVDEPGQIADARADTRSA